MVIRWPLSLLDEEAHGTLLPHSVCSPIYENALSPDSWEQPTRWCILLSCEGLVCEKRRCVQIWPLVTAGWPVHHTGLLTSNYIVHIAVVLFSKFNISCFFCGVERSHSFGQVLMVWWERELTQTMCKQSLSLQLSLQLLFFLLRHHGKAMVCRLVRVKGSRQGVWPYLSCLLQGSKLSWTVNLLERFSREP